MQSSITDKTAFIALLLNEYPESISGICINCAILDEGMIPACANVCNCLSFSDGSLDKASAPEYWIVIFFVSPTMSDHLMFTLAAESGSILSLFLKQAMHVLAMST